MDWKAAMSKLGRAATQKAAAAAKSMADAASERLSKVSDSQPPPVAEDGFECVVEDTIKETKASSPSPRVKLVGRKATPAVKPLPPIPQSSRPAKPPAARKETLVQREVVDLREGLLYSIGTSLFRLAMIVGGVIVGGVVFVITAGLWWGLSPRTAQQPIATSPTIPVVAPVSTVTLIPAVTPLVTATPFSEAVSALDPENVRKPVVAPAIAATLPPLPVPVAGEAVKPAPATTFKPPTTRSSAIPDRLTKPGPDYVWVDGYTRSDGTHVDGYWRHSPPKPAPIKPTPAKPSSPAATTSSSGRVWVKGYTRKDGTKVDGYYRNK